MSLPSPSLSQEPTQEQQYKFDLLNTPVLETVRLVSSYLGRITAASDSIPDRQHLTRFHARTIPSIDVLGYTSRILKYAPCGNECFLAALIYFERMGEPSQRVLTAGFTGRGVGGPVCQTTDATSGSFTGGKRMSHRAAIRKSSSQQQLSAADSEPLIVDSYNVHRLLIAGIMVAVKFLSDVFFTNLHMSRVGGLPVHELNQLEVEFLLLNDFNLSVSVEELQYCGDRLLEEMNGMKSTVKMDRMVRDVEAITVNETHPERREGEHKSNVRPSQGPVGHPLSTRQFQTESDHKPSSSASHDAHEQDRHRQRLDSQQPHQSGANNELSGRRPTDSFRPAINTSKSALPDRFVVPQRSASMQEASKDSYPPPVNGVNHRWSAFPLSAGYVGPRQELDRHHFAQPTNLFYYADNHSSAHSYTSPPPCLEPRYVSEALSRSTGAYVFRPTFSPPRLPVPMKRTASWHPSGSAMACTGIMNYAPSFAVEQHAGYPLSDSRHYTPQHAPYQPIPSSLSRQMPSLSPPSQPQQPHHYRPQYHPYPRAGVVKHHQQQPQMNLSTHHRFQSSPRSRTSSSSPIRRSVTHHQHYPQQPASPIPTPNRTRCNTGEAFDQGKSASAVGPLGDISVLIPTTYESPPYSPPNAPIPYAHSTTQRYTKPSFASSAMHDPQSLRTNFQYYAPASGPLTPSYQSPSTYSDNHSESRFSAPYHSTPQHYQPEYRPEYSSHPSSPSPSRQVLPLPPIQQPLASSHYSHIHSSSPAVQSHSSSPVEAATNLPTYSGAAISKQAGKNILTKPLPATQC